MEMDMGMEIKTNTTTKTERGKKTKKETPGVVQAAAKRGGKSRPRAARTTAASGAAGPSSYGPNNGRSRTRTYSHGGLDFTSRLCDDGVWRIENVQKTETVEVAGAGAGAGGSGTNHEISNVVA